MNPRTIIFAVLAIAAAGVTGLLVQGWLERQRAVVQPVQQVVEQAHQSVLVAAKPLPAGRIIRPNDLSWQVWPKDGIAPAFRVQGKHQIKDFVGAVVRRGIDAKTPVTDASIVRPGDRGFLAAVLRPGYRAVGVPVNASSVVAGLVFPGDQVDLILAYKYEVKLLGAKAGADKEIRQASETVLSNVRVLALDQNTDDQNGKKGVPKTATLEITPKQAETVALASQIGRLSLSLRSLAKDEDGEELIAGKPESKSAKVQKAKSDPDDEEKSVVAENENKPYREKGTITRDSDVSRLLRSGRGGGKVIHVMRGSKAETSPVQGTGR